MTLYIYEENYHFEGHIAGVIVDDKRVALFYQTGVNSEVIKLPDDIVWHELELLEEQGNNVTIGAKNLAFYKQFYCLEKRTLTCKKS